MRSTRVWAIVGKVLAVSLAAFGIALLYRFGLADIGGALVLSAIIVTVITFVRSGALSATWLSLRDRNRIVRLGHLELAKAFGCAGLGVDIVRGLYGMMPYSFVSGVIVLTVAVVSAMGTGLFLVRWFAAYLTVRRR